MSRMLTLCVALLAGGTSAALAQFPPQPAAPKCGGPEMGSPQDRAACQSDVVRFCQTQLRTNECDVFAILGCLQTNRARLSAPCRGVLVQNGK